MEETEKRGKKFTTKLMFPVSRFHKKGQRVIEKRKESFPQKSKKERKIISRT